MNMGMSMDIAREKGEKSIIGCLSVCRCIRVRVYVAFVIPFTLSIKSDQTKIERKDKKRNWIALLKDFHPRCEEQEN